jgi:DNA-binding transcriptional ArsR family regulator
MSKTKGFTVSKLAKTLKRSQSTVTQHLKELKVAGKIK